MDLILDFFTYLALASALIIFGGIFVIPFIVDMEKGTPRVWMGMSLYRIYRRIVVIGGIIIVIVIFLTITSPFPMIPDKCTVSVCRLNNMCRAIVCYSDRFGKLTDFSHKELFAKLVPEYLDVEPARRFLFWKCYSDFVNEKGEFVDAWGHPLVIKASASGDAVRAYSVGENGIDENGKGDDIETSTVIPYKQKLNK